MIPANFAFFMSKQGHGDFHAFEYSVETAVGYLTKIYTCIFEILIHGLYRYLSWLVSPHESKIRAHVPLASDHRLGENNAILQRLLGFALTLA
ncbi:hypothetical protein RRG08_039431 [Elysia crispata]|uniref:Uncharacterized protein n=1 Tax=Elysia crispata TaxID=231223 RepID=A0AAE1AAP8_9GAST|nr:hypothetical protein RRG08_039431 [Elysia crispata]